MPPSNSHGLFRIVQLQADFLGRNVLDILDGPRAVCAIILRRNEQTAAELIHVLEIFAHLLNLALVRAQFQMVEDLPDHIVTLVAKRTL
jgi:hypothetical protein